MVRIFQFRRADRPTVEQEPLRRVCAYLDAAAALLLVIVAWLLF